MDDRSFDRLARLLGGATDRRTGLKALAGGILGAGGLAALDADATRKGRKDDGPRAGRKKRKKCNPACDAGFTCVKGTCTCPGVNCGGACCASGQVCRDGACAEPRPACLPFGTDCKDAGRPCCDGLTCASGQDGSYPVTCLRSKGASCAGDAECPFGMSCTDGRCLGDGAPAVPTGASCAGGETCAQPGASCGAYTTPGAPAGDFCTLPLRMVCTGNPECACYNCWYVNEGASSGGRQGRAAAPVKQCIQPTGGACTSDADCASGLACNLGTGKCGTGTQCVPDGGPCASGPCCGTSTCNDGVCSGGGTSCTVKRSDYASDALAGAALKTAVENATDGAEITVGPGTYKPVPGAGQRAALVISASITLKACDPTNKPTVDGGATVTKTAGGGTPGATDNAKALTWTGGNRIVLVQANQTVTIDGINMTNGNSAAELDELANGAAVLALQPSTVTLKNLDISRSSTQSSTSTFDAGGAISAVSGTSDNANRKLTLQNVAVTQCRARYGGAVNTEHVPLEIAGTAAARSRLARNFAAVTGGAIYCWGRYTDAQLQAFGTTRVATFSHVDVTDNEAADTDGGVFLKDPYLSPAGGKGTASLSDVTISGNTAATYSGGLGVHFGDAPSAPGGATLTTVLIQNNRVTGVGRYGGGLLNAGRLDLGSDVVISGNKAAKGSGVYNSVATALVTCTSQRVSGNTSLTDQTPVSGDTYADCFGGNTASSSGGVATAANVMPAPCCATDTP